LISPLADFTAHLLTESGAVVESNGDGLEVLVPAEVAAALEIPEHAELSFSGDGRDAIAVSYDSEIFKKMAKLLGDHGKFSTVAFVPPAVKLEKLEDRLEGKLLFHNAVFSLERKGEKRISYLLGYCKYAARSDDRQEGILGCLMNELNLAAQTIRPDILEVIASSSEEPLLEAARESSETVLSAFSRAQREIAKEALSDFLTSMERRLNRDIRRVHDYYETLIHEHRQLLEKKLGTPDDKGKAASKIQAIQRELKSKIQDLIGKFGIDLSFEPISFIRVEAVTRIFWVSVKRRKEVRAFPLTYNPVLKSFDPLPCESCFYPRKGHYVCDDRLHILCRQCFAPCLRCDRSFCAACHPRGCPRCSLSGPSGAERTTSGQLV
jgi:hypothetical protein